VHDRAPAPIPCYVPDAPGKYDTPLALGSFVTAGQHRRRWRAIATSGKQPQPAQFGEYFNAIAPRPAFDEQPAVPVAQCETDSIVQRASTTPIAALTARATERRSYLSCGHLASASALLAAGSDSRPSIQASRSLRL
jgi:hypothetical protein